MSLINTIKSLFSPTEKTDTYWWDDPILRLGMIGKTIVKVTGEGCQGRNQIQWVGKVIGFNKNKKQEYHEIVIEIVLHDKSYTDARDGNEQEMFVYPLINNDIQNVKDVWILYN